MVEGGQNRINENRISDTRFEKLLGVTFDNQLNFNHHISKICKTASNKLHALARVSIRTFYLNLITVPWYWWITTNQ